MVLHRSKAWGILVVLAVYVGSYAILSLSGKFVPGCVGTGGVKWYYWMPRGFMRNQRTVLAYLFYYPLHYLDLRYIHSDDKAYRGGYPRQDYWD